MADKLSDFLFATPSFLSGLVRVLDLGGLFDRYNISRTQEEADARAMEADWEAIRLDLERAWFKLVIDHPDFVSDLADAIAKDPYLTDLTMKAIEAARLEPNGEREEKETETTSRT